MRPPFKAPEHGRRFARAGAPGRSRRARVSTSHMTLLLPPLRTSAASAAGATNALLLTASASLGLDLRAGHRPRVINVFPGGAPMTAKDEATPLLMTVRQLAQHGDASARGAQLSAARPAASGHAYRERGISCFRHRSSSACTLFVRRNSSASRQRKSRKSSATACSGIVPARLCGTSSGAGLTTPANNWTGCSPCTSGWSVPSTPGRSFRTPFRLAMTSAH